MLYLIIQDRLENKTEAGHSRLGDLPAHQLFILRNQYPNVCVQRNGLLELEDLRNSSGRKKRDVKIYENKRSKFKGRGIYVSVCQRDYHFI